MGRRGEDPRAVAKAKEDAREKQKDEVSHKVKTADGGTRREPGKAKDAE